jgi:hypothetical protein
MVAKVPKRNSEILADTFSRAQTFYFSFAFALEELQRIFRFRCRANRSRRKAELRHFYRPSKG